MCANVLKDCKAMHLKPSMLKDQLFVPLVLTFKTLKADSCKSPHFNVKAVLN